MSGEMSGENHMSIGCLVITTNLPSRIGMTMNLLDSIDQAAYGERGHGKKLNTRVLSIDLQPHMVGCEKELRDMYERRGWFVVEGPCAGERAMLNNIQRGLAYIEEEFLFYCEDHVVIDSIPPEGTLYDLWNRIGVNWINYNTHVHQENLLNIPGYVEPPGREMKLAYINDPTNWIESDYGDFLVKQPKIRDEYNLCFPAAITPRKYFEAMMNYGLANYSGIGIEIGFTRAYDDLDLSYASHPAIYTRPGTVDLLPFKTFGELHQRAGMKFRNNDPTMLHDSIVPHVSMPKEPGKRRSFF